ncbi:multidrug effflux MFS transporter [Clostridium tyrobutyricum]|uniref:multidrug effflux MFS transporter n=1 Tax=Clostridium tyrobutyricum TaxID=1519 RepID=UPI0020123E41|nr:multidrug effflux MFS transporter [Clostridium tyrobutyricum]MBR9648417.1 multidrug effflux MFS transporter [Clostridium tyrobutyricum]
MKEKSSKLLILLLGTLSAFGPLSMDMYLPSLPLIERELNTNASFTQMSITTCLIGLALGQLLIGPYSDKHGRKKPLLLGLITFTIISFACSFITSIWVLIFLRFIQGLSGAAGLVISSAIARDLYDGKALTKFFSLLMAVNGVFPILSPIFGGIILKFTTWKGVFVVLGIIGTLLFVFTLIFFKETLSTDNLSNIKSEHTLTILKTLIKDRVFISYALIQGLVMGAMFCYISGSSFILQNIFGLSPQQFSIVFAINGLGIVLMSQITGKLALKSSENLLLQIGVTIAALGSIALFTSLFLPRHMLFVTIPLFFIVSMVGVVNTSGFSLAMQNQKKSAGSASAILGLGMNLIGGLLSPLVGMGGNHTYVPMAVLILFCDISAFLIFYLYLAKKVYSMV